MSDLITLTLQPDNPCNTTISDSEDGKVLYHVATEHGDNTTTRVKNAAQETIASWEWRDVRSDLLTLGNGSPISSSAWLKKSMVPFKDTVSFEGPGGKTYKWKGNGPGLAFELFTEDDKTKPIAHFQKSRRTLNRKTDPPSQELTPAQLVLDSRGEEIQDLVVISFLQLEKSRRARESSTMNRADALATPGVSMGSNYAMTNGGV